MDGLALLQRVSETYRNLKYLAVAATLITESGDENSHQRGEQRVDFYYAAPGRVRYETRGGGGMLVVADGAHLHTIFGRRGGREARYASTPVERVHRLPHLFRSEFPIGAGDEPFLYQGVDENVTAAAILREEDGCRVVSVSYAPAAHPHLLMTFSPTLLWVDSKNMVVRQQGDVGHRPPAEDDLLWTRHTISVREMRVDEPIPDETFHFTPPPGVEPLAAGGCGVSVGGGSGFTEQRPGSGDVVEHRGSHEWQGDTLIERSTWKLRGMTLTFERRLTFSADNRELRVDERITGPGGDVQTRATLPLA